MEFMDNWFNRRMLRRYVECVSAPAIKGKILIRAAKPGLIHMGRNVRINSSYEANPVGGFRTALVSVNGGTIEIGANTGISNSGIFAFEQVKVGEDVYMGAGCNIYDSNFHSVHHKERKNANSGIKSAPVTIGDRVFIGAHSLILKGVTIGADSVIAAGAVVVKDVPKKEIWGGNPAKFLCKI
jgi:acetyltransferase-like isoleucine patch superfamily enzyme